MVSCFVKGNGWHPGIGSKSRGGVVGICGSLWGIVGITWATPHSMTGGFVSLLALGVGRSVRFASATHIGGARCATALDDLPLSDNLSLRCDGRGRRGPL